MIELVSAKDLAGKLGFAGPGDAFRNFCRELGIQPLRRNPSFYDPKLVRLRMDEAQGLAIRTVVSPEVEDLVAARRARRAQV